MWWEHGMHGWNGHWLGGWGMAVLGILVVIVCFLLVRGIASHGGGRRGNTESPLDILKRRYASGEIGKAEFDERKKDLTG